MKFILAGFLVAMVTFGTSLQALASEPEYIGNAGWPHSEFALGLGSAQQTGYLTTADALGVFNFAYHIFTPRGIFGIEITGFKGTHDTGEFLLAQNKAFSVSTFAFMSYIEVYSREALSTYLGIGLAEVSVAQNEPDYRTNFASFILAGLVRYQFAEKWSVQWKTQWYNVVQTANSQSTSFEVWNNTLGVGYKWR